MTNSRVLERNRKPWAFQSVAARAPPVLGRAELYSQLRPQTVVTTDS